MTNYNQGPVISNNNHVSVTTSYNLKPVITN